MCSQICPEFGLSLEGKTQKERSIYILQTALDDLHNSLLWIARLQELARSCGFRGDIDARRLDFRVPLGEDGDDRVVLSGGGDQPNLRSFPPCVED